MKLVPLTIELDVTNVSEVEFANNLLKTLFEKAVLKPIETETIESHTTAPKVEEKPVNESKTVSTAVPTFSEPVQTAAPVAEVKPEPVPEVKPEPVKTEKPKAKAKPAPVAEVKPEPIEGKVIEVEKPQDGYQRKLTKEQLVNSEDHVPTEDQPWEGKLTVGKFAKLLSSLKHRREDIFEMCKDEYGVPSIAKLDESMFPELYDRIAHYRDEEGYVTKNPYLK